MTVRILGTCLVAGVVFASAGYAQTDNNTPPNAVEDRSFVERPTTSQSSADTSVGYVFDQSSGPPDVQTAIPMAPRVNKRIEVQPVERPTVR
jgi:hypothetical protein